ncbi:MAG: hypothetical protein K8W52_39040 [Deltaproteobacteria bacterium]|nr:hypothetical protein [Deltaproteobacteria bacterium]
MRVSLTLAALCALGGAAIAQPAPPAPPTPAAQANALANSAAAHYKKGERLEALQDMRSAYAVDPRPDFIYGIARLEAELNDCDGAIAHYKRYITDSPGTQGAVDAQAGIAACEAKLGITHEAAPDVKPDVTPDVKPTIVRQPPPPPPRAKPFYTDPLGDGLAVGGLAGGVAGLVLYLGARSDIDKSETAATLQAHLDLVDKAEQKRTYAVVAGAVGGALVVGAVVRWATRSKGERATVALVPTGDGWSFAALGRF